MVTHLACYPEGVFFYRLLLKLSVYFKNEPIFDPKIADKRHYEVNLFALRWHSPHSCLPQLDREFSFFPREVTTSSPHFLASPLITTAASLSGVRTRKGKR